MDCSTLGFPALQDLPEFAQTHFHWVDDAIQPSHTLLPTSLAFNLSQHQLLFGCSAVSDSLWPRGLQINRLLCPWNSPGKNTGVGCHFILQGIFGTQGLNPCVLCVLHWQADYLPTEPPGSPAWGSFPMSWLFTSGGQSIGASASTSVLPMHIQGWFPLGVTGLISLLCKGLSKVFSSTTVQKHQFFSAQPSLWSNSYLCMLLLNHFSRVQLCATP